MSAILPSWIKIDDALGDLSQLLPELEAYSKFAAHWREIAVAVRNVAAETPVDSPVNLAAFLAGHIGDAEIGEIFGTLGLAELHSELSALGNRFLDPSAPWAKLLRPANEFVETYIDRTSDELAFDDGENPGLVALQIPKLAADADTGLVGGALSFAIGAEAGLECEAGAAWPFRGDAVQPGLLRIGAEGKVEATAGFSLPFGKIGKGEVNIGASAEARLDFFFRPTRPDIAYAEAVAGALTGLPNPLSLSDLNHAVQLAGMEGVTLYCNGAASAGLAAILGANYNFKQLASISAGLVAELNFKRNARWLLSLRNTSAGLRFVLSRNLSRERDWSVGFDIGIDYSGLARQVHDALSEAQEFLGPKLDAVRPFLSPGTYLANQLNGQLNAAVASIVSEPQLRAALEQNIGLVLGLAPSRESAVSAYLREKIIDLAANNVGGVLSDAEQWARYVAEGLASNFPALSETDVVAKLIARIQPTLNDAKTQFDSVVTKLVGQADIEKALTDIAVDLDKNLAKADRLTAGLRKLVSDFDHFSRELLMQVGEGVEHKLAARFAWSGGASQGTQYELIGTLDQVNQDTSALWRALVTGQLEPFQRILADPTSAPSGLQLDPKSSLARFAGKHKGFALEIVAFDTSVSIRSIVRSEARIAVSAGGDVTVFAKGSAEREVDGFNEGRSASFLSTWDLALLKADDPVLGGQRKMGIALKLDHDDDNLKSSELTGFLHGLERTGLVESSRILRASEIYQSWRTATSPGKKVKGRIDVGFALTGQAVSRMVAIGRLCGTDGSASHRAMFTAAAQTLLACGVSDLDRLNGDSREARRKFKPLADINDPWQIAYALRKIDLTPQEAAGTSGYTYSAFGKLIELSKNFPRLLSQVALIYDAIPVGATGHGVPWGEKDYVRAELALASDARKWLRLNQKLIFWFKSEMHPALLAFLRLLADMNQVTALDDPLDGLDSRVDVATCNGLFAISMKGTGDAVSI